MATAPWELGPVTTETIVSSPAVAAGGEEEEEAAAMPCGVEKRLGDAAAEARRRATCPRSKGQEALKALGIIASGQACRTVRMSDGDASMLSLNVLRRHLRVFSRKNSKSSMGIDTQL